ncbi:2-deoxyribose-5-phosphate aldolase [Legionella brunensis]|uniref:deoxyribose-phosphate aldolase n=1 Tax=Legionella brunensis TaxID=29422 RepID=A0A0W0S4F6_9GAMM|nr:hypothetical protein [Legionella brunensis]KTC78312.1 2-deoxyribose-5-phosphate aldolase [Legionella brunensis]
MNLEAQFLTTLGELNEISWDMKKLSAQAISLIDLTLLDEKATSQDLKTLSEKGNVHQVAAICVLPQHLSTIAPVAATQLTTVINFPTGTQALSEVLTEIDQIMIHNQVNEIDYVFPYQNYLKGEKREALEHCHHAYTRCKQHGVIFKVILETGALPTLESIFALSCEIISQGCDFLKTSTGRINQGTTPSAAFAMLKAIENSNTSCGLKVSGGIKTPEQAFTYMCLAKQIRNRDLDNSWFRIGASSLLDELMRT